MSKFIDDLGALSDPRMFNGPVDAGSIGLDTLEHFYSEIYKIRKCEEILADLARAGEINTPVHLGIGQEAIAVAFSHVLNSGDRIFSNHRGHSHYISVGGSIERLFAEVLGRATGASRGMGGSMHLVDRSAGFYGSVPIVGGTIPIAVGAALALKRDGNRGVSVAYFGDGACEEGVLHESLNLARVMELPVLFICENNLYSSHMDIFLRQPSNSVKRFAEAHKVTSYLVDGNNVVDLLNVALSAVESARSGAGPAFIEAVTFRWRGHVGPEMDIDVGVNRSLDELTAWQGRDPLGRLETALLALGFDKSMCERRKFEIDEELSEMLERARAADLPSEKNILGFVYADE